MVKNSGGFTLFEVMITMAVSGSMLVMAVIMFGGQQRKTQFTQSMRDVESKIQDIINDTATGYFPSTTLRCVSDSTNGPQFDNSASTQGGNQGCVFLGKAMHIQRDKIDIYPVIGNSDLSAATFRDAKPVVAADTATATLVDTKQFLWGLSAYDVLWEAAGGTTVSKKDEGRLIAVVSTPNGTGSTVSGDSLNSGIQRINAYTSGTNAATNIGNTSGVTIINAALQNANFSNWVPIGDKVTICLEDASTGPGRQYGGIVITGGSTSIGVRMQTDADTVRCT